MQNSLCSEAVLIKSQFYGACANYNFFSPGGQNELVAYNSVIQICCEELGCSEIFQIIHLYKCALLIGVFSHLNFFCALICKGDRLGMCSLQKVGMLILETIMLVNSNNYPCFLILQCKISRQLSTAEGKTAPGKCRVLFSGEDGGRFPLG